MLVHVSILNVLTDFDIIYFFLKGLVLLVSPYKFHQDSKIVCLSVSFYFFVIHLSCNFRKKLTKALQFVSIFKV